MKLAAFCGQRPVFTVMVTLIAVILGLNSLDRLPIDLMPEVDYPTVRISASYEGAGPEEVESQVVERIENAVAPVAGVESIESTSAEGQGDVILSFAWGTDLDAAANDIRERIDRILPNLPDGVERPRLRFIDMSDRPVMVLGLASDLDPIELRRLAEDRVRDRLERIPGVGSVDIWGGLEREIEIAVDRGRLQAVGLALEDVRSALADADFEVAAGTREEGRHERGLRVPGRVTDLDTLATVVVGRGEDGARIRLADIAEVRDTHERETRRIRVDGVQGIRLGVRARTDANTVETARALRSEIEQLREDMPQIGLLVVRDTAVYIERSMANLGRTILFGGVLALLVMLVFMRDFRAAAVAGVAIPVSLVTTFTLVYFAGFTLNLMTLGGMALGVGLMVDNAIVVLESILARRERGMPAYRAAVEGTSEVAPAVTASTLTTLAIFLPLIFLEGLAGALFSQLAWVVGFALVASLLVAFTVVPMLAARLPQQRRRGPPRWYKRLEWGYRRLLSGALKQRGAVMVLAFSVVALAMALVPRLGTELMPDTDEGDLRISFEWEPGISLEFMDERMQHLEQQVLEHVPEVEHWDSSSGTGGFRAGGGHTSRIDMALVPLTERQRSTEEVADSLRREFANEVPGAEVRVRARGMRMMRGGAGADGEELSISVYGYQRETLDQIAKRIESLIEGVDGVTDVSFSMDDSSPEERLVIDRVRAADLNVPVSRIADTIEAAVAGARAGLYRAQGGEEVAIQVRLAQARQIEMEELLDLTVPSGDGEQIALRNVVDVVDGESPLTIERRDRQRVTTVVANIGERDLGSVVADVRDELAGLPLPRGYGWWIGGEYEEQAEALRQLTITLMLAVLLVYMVMASLYESLRNPFVVMFTVPFAGVGAVLMLWLTGTTINAQSFIGIIMLAGIVVNNGILIVDRANRSLRAGAPPRQAVLIAGRRRLRPVLMTSLTTGLALAPLAIGFGEGAEAQAPMARSVLGGLISGTLITLVVIPLVFTLMHRRRGGVVAGN